MTETPSEDRLAEVKELLNEAADIFAKEIENPHDESAAKFRGAAEDLTKKNVLAEISVRPNVIRNLMNRVDEDSQGRLEEIAKQLEES